MAEGVDLALVIALDGSASVTFEEFNMIAGGMAAAFRDPLVAKGLTGGPAGASLACLLLWSGTGAQKAMIPWTRVASAADADRFAGMIDDMPRGVQAGATAIGEALLAAITLLAHLPGPAARQVVNVVGDGRSNNGIAPGPIRDRMAAAGITINGLCILHEEPDLLDSYTNEVIGGPGAFAVICPDYAAFAEAMRRKLLRELEQPTV
ncbi:MAG: DUF1194 domain-containing protein [Proteobacteria bacterium]|nr:DUF1194 domain-containing protein [Pseudomonadota bacterium]